MTSITTIQNGMQITSYENTKLKIWDGELNE